MENCQKFSNTNICHQKDQINMSKKTRSIEVEGKTVGDAILRSLDILKVKREDVEIKILCEEKKGLFGMEGAKPAKIKVSLKG